MAKIQCHQVEDDSCIDDTFTKKVSEFVETDADELLLEGLEEMEKEEASSSDSLSSYNLLYHDAQINYDDSMLLIMAFSVRHKLSGAAIEDLAQLLSLLCPGCANTVKNLGEFQTFLEALQNPIVRLYSSQESDAKFTLELRNLDVKIHVFYAMNLFHETTSSWSFL